MEKIIYNHPLFKERRKKLRKEETLVEKLLWQELKNRKFCNLKFYRQYSVGMFILDFYCPKFRLAVELDGGYHEDVDQKGYDQERDLYLQDKDIKTIRFRNEEIENDLELVLIKMKNLI